MTVQELIDELMKVEDKETKKVELAVNDTLAENFRLSDNVGTILFLTNKHEVGYKPKILEWFK